MNLAKYDQATVDNCSMTRVMTTKKINKKKDYRTIVGYQERSDLSEIRFY